MFANEPFADVRRIIKREERGRERERERDDRGRIVGQTGESLNALLFFSSSSFRLGHQGRQAPGKARKSQASKINAFSGGQAKNLNVAACVAQAYIKFTTGAR